MEIIFFILGFLKIVLYIVLAILFIIILLLAIILFVPIRYTAVVDTNDLIKNKADKIFVDVKVMWLLGIFKYIYRMEAKETQSEVLIFGRNFFKEKEPEINKKNIEKKVDSKKENLSRGKNQIEKSFQVNENSTEDKKIELKSNEQSEKTIHVEEKINPTDEKNSSLKRTSKPKEEKEKKKSKKENEEKESIIDKFNEMKEKFYFYYNYKDRDLIVKKFFDKTEKFLKTLKPKNFNIKAEVGFNDPSLTGKILGAASIFSAAIGVMPFILGNFKESKIVLSGHTKGKIFLGASLLPIVQFILYKPVFKIVKKNFFAK